MPEAKVIPIRPRRYRCSFETGSDAAVAFVAVTAARFGVVLDVREEPSDREEPPLNHESLSGPAEFRGSNVRLDEQF